MNLLLKPSHLHLVSWSLITKLFFFYFLISEASDQASAGGKAFFVDVAHFFV